ncbi:MAG: hypothetical protein LBD75_00100 [Candidatus Peribacteria bacterium]|jgi:hypothetical protein|nr:hypothetical protein [Candidatus Peribacteria bacterium]
MTQKAQVLELLHALKPYRELSEGMIALIDAGFMDNDTLTNLLFMITAVIKSLPEGEEKTLLKEKLDAIKKTLLKKAE